MKRKPNPLPEEVAPIPPNETWSARNPRHLGRRRFLRLQEESRWWRSRDNLAKREHL